MQIKLHTPRYLNDTTTITEFEANDIVHVESVSGDPNEPIATFWIKGVDESRFCLESVNELKKMIEDNKDNKDNPIFNNYSFGDRIEQTGLNISLKNLKFNFQSGFVSGVIASIVAAYIYDLIIS